MKAHSLDTPVEPKQIFLQWYIPSYMQYVVEQFAILEMATDTGLHPCPYQTLSMI